MKSVRYRRIGFRIERPWERRLARENGTSRHWGDRIARQSRYWATYVLHFLAALHEARRKS